MPDNFLLPFFVIFIFSTLIEAIIEYLVGNVQKLRPYLPLLSLAVAILLCFAYQVSLFNIFLGLPVTNPFMEFLLSAFIIARISNYLNDFVQKVLGGK